MKYLCCVLCTATALSISSMAQAITINLDVSDLVSTYSGTGAAPDTGTYWNVASTVNTTYSNLKASNGTTSTAVNVGFRNWLGEYSWLGSLLVNDRFYGPDVGMAYIDLSGLTANSKYDLYLYASFWTDTFSVPGLSFKTARPVHTTIPWIEGDQYVLLSGALADSQGKITVTVTATGQSNGQWTNLAGIQIVNANTVPEPSTAALLSIGLGGLIKRRRRRVIGGGGRRLGEL